MDFFLKKLRCNEKGQTMVEYLLLMSVTFIVAYLMITAGPLPKFTSDMIADIRARLENIVRNGEMQSNGTEQGQPGHPTDARRMKPLHL